MSGHMAMLASGGYAGWQATFRAAFRDAGQAGGPGPEGRPRAASRRGCGADRLRRPVFGREERPHYLRDGPDRLVRGAGERQRPGGDGGDAAVVNGYGAAARGLGPGDGGVHIRPAVGCVPGARHHPGRRSYRGHVRPAAADSGRGDAGRGGQGPGGADLWGEGGRQRRADEGDSGGGHGDPGARGVRVAGSGGSGRGGPSESGESAVRARHQRPQGG